MTSEAAELEEAVNRSFARREALPTQARVAIAEAKSRLSGPEARIVQRELEELAREETKDSAALADVTRLALFGVDRGEVPASEALSWAQIAAAEDPENPRSRILMADALERVGEQSAALEELVRLLDESRWAAMFGVFFRVGVLNYNLGRFKDAEVAYRQALVVRPTATVHLYLADALRAKDEREAARHHYLEALRRNRMLVDALRGYWALGTGNELEEGPFDILARRLLEARVKPVPLNRWVRPALWAVLCWRLWRHPEDARLHFMLGYCALLRRDYKFARERLTFAHLLPPARDYEALVLAALASALEGQLDDAAAMLDDALHQRLALRPDAYGRHLRSGDMLGRLISPFIWEPRLQHEPWAQEAMEVVFTRIKPEASEEQLR